jgi:hypothetical protein
MADTKLTGLSAVTNPTVATKLYAVATEGEASSATGGGSLRLALSNLLKLGVDLKFFPTDNEYGSGTAPLNATLDTRNNHPVLDFDATATELAMFTGIMPRAYGGSGVNVALGVSATSATGGSVGWSVRFERVGDQQQDVDSSSFATGNEIVAATVATTVGAVDVVSVNVANGAAMDSVAAGEQFRLRVKRDTNSQDAATAGAAGDAELHWVRVREQ